MEKNNMISFWRIIFTLMIALFHFFNVYGFATGWYIGTDFFFLVSGWLLAKDAATKDRSAYSYTLHRIKRLYPEYIIAFIYSAVIMADALKYTASDLFGWLRDSGIYELFMMHTWGWNNRDKYANVPTWYLSALIISSLVLYSLLKICPRLLKEVIIPVLALVYMTYSFRTFGNIGIDEVVGPFGNMRLLRGLTEMALGILIYSFNRKYGYLLKSKGIRAFGFILLAFTAVHSFFEYGNMDYIYIILLSVGIAISFEAPLPSRRKVITVCDKYSYSFFLNHSALRNYIMPKFFDGITAWSMIVYLICVALISVVTHNVAILIARFCRVMFDNYKKKMSRKKRRRRRPVSRA